MKPLIQKLPIAEETSFVARTYSTPYYETTWHQHAEVELIVQLNGYGMCFIGNYIGEFKAGDIFLLGSNLPHEFKKANEDMKCSVMVIHFDPNFWGKDFWQIPESKEIKQLLHQSLSAIKLSGEGTLDLAKNMQKLETATGFERISLLCQCLSFISKYNDKKSLSSLNAANFASTSDDKINKIFEYTINNFKDAISLTTVAAIANMSVSAFCRYFKRNTKKTYVEFVNEMRIGHACNTLVNTNMSITDICYDCGFNTIANFNKQFLKIKGIKPSTYKKQFGIKYSI